MEVLHAVPAPELPLIEDVRPRSDDDDALFAELREVLERHGAATRFGICLLHRHFAVADDEMLLETCDAASRTLVMRPRPADECSGSSVVETSWRLDSPGITQRCQTKCDNSSFGHTRGHTTLS
jgi:hypothetical protein